MTVKKEKRYSVYDTHLGTLLACKEMRERLVPEVLMVTGSGQCGFS